MAEAFMAYPELRYPFETTPIHPEGDTTILYPGRRITLSETGASEEGRLLIRPEDLPRINGFELKPQGACFEDLCIPISHALLVERDGSRWFDLTAFADLLEQPWVADTDARVWSFAEVPVKRDNMMQGAMVPDIEIRDREGNVIRLPDLKGRKALIVTWSSW